MKTMSKPLTLTEQFGKEVTPPKSVSKAFFGFRVRAFEAKGKGEKTTTLLFPGVRDKKIALRVHARARYLDLRIKNVDLGERCIVSLRRKSFKTAFPK